MENEYHLYSHTKAAGDSNHCLLVLNNNEGKHINFHIALKKLNEIVDTLNEGVVNQQS